VFCVGPLCGLPLRWWVLCAVLPSVWVPCGWGPPPVVSAFHVASTRVMSRARAHAPAYSRTRLSTLHVEYAMQRIKYGILFISSLFYEYMSCICTCSCLIQGPPGGIRDSYSRGCVPGIREYLFNTWVLHTRGCFLFPVDDGRSRRFERLSDSTSSFLYSKRRNP